MFAVNRLGKLLLILIIFLLVYFDQAWTFYPPTESIDQMDIRVGKSFLEQAPYHLLWFGQEDRTLKLHYNTLLGDQPLSLYALTKQEAVVMVPPQQSQNDYRLNKDYSGTFVAMIPPVKLNLGKGGGTEKIQLSAKIDTLFSQPFKPIRTTFGDHRIPFEICFMGHQTILLLFNGRPLSAKKVRLVSRREYGCAVDKIVATDATGMLQLNDVRDLRTGISVVYLGKDQTKYISSYRLEANSMFTKRYQAALIPVVEVLQWSVLLIILLAVWQKVYLLRGRAVLTAKLAGGMSTEWFDKPKITRV